MTFSQPENHGNDFYLDLLLRSAQCVDTARQTVIAPE